ncbi:hypothetical protein MYCTH_2301397 [Thermothelomyces thermophilus ATCC 42464]|uniref:Uncharacterized protein n=1 Tax=Thermothelomyces thermophilus (strain ATCC 42464 / BCRC 31852 / DSM 1799) TaxID=573729 RepID=G2Q9H9_THET4|nr:uncharacterized protein MYCTH_2301397 [Thermothelomyces thermophilus ATCC 42464]AEO56438.1 hypothetical protein MYCTH_2301397 [Thermothelomyces thermophilus ATCC 42464]
MLRFWAACDKHWEEDDDDEDGFAKGWKPNVAITVFTGSSKSRKEHEPHTEATMPDGQETGLWPTSEEVASREVCYCPPPWALSPI